MSLENQLATIGTDAMVDDADERRLAGTIGAQQAENLSLADMEGHIVERTIVAECFCDIIDL